MVKKDTRYWEIDFVRGIAVIMMILYHIFFDFTFLGIFIFPINSLPFLLFLYPIGALFLLLVGVSLTLKYSQIKTRIQGTNRFLSFFKQGFRIFIFGLLITAATYYYPHQGFIVFGVLHCIGISIILAYPFISYRYLSLIIGFLCIVIGIFVSAIQIETPWFLWMGLRPVGFFTLDYFPLLPWFGIVLIGTYLGNTLYPNGKRLFLTEKQRYPQVAMGVSYLGKHSLIIYLLHQPIIYGLLLMIFPA